MDNNKQEITPAQALNNLFLVSRSCNLPADQHEVLKQCALILKDFIERNEGLTKKEGE